MLVQKGQHSPLLLLLGLGHLALVVGQSCECTPTCDSDVALPDNCARANFDALSVSCECTNKCGPELCRDGYVEVSADDFCLDNKISSTYIAEVCKNEQYCFTPNGCAECEAGFVLQADGTCAGDPCLSRDCPKKSVCRLNKGFPECRCKKGYVMTFNNATGDECQTVVDAVNEDKELLPMDDEGEPIVALQAVTSPGSEGVISSGSDADGAYSAVLMVSLGVLAFVLVNLVVLGLIFMHVKNTSTTLKYHKDSFEDSIVAIEENVTDLHINVQDLHLMTFYDEEAAEKEEAKPDPLPGSTEENGDSKAKKSLKDVGTKIKSLNRIRADQGLPVRQQKHGQARKTQRNMNKDWV
jgi:hypothetical protein